MEYRVLGKTGLKISRLGFGGIPIQKITKEETKPLLQYLMEQGVNYIDTARGYTVSEEYIGYSLDGIRDRFVLATKSMARTAQGMEQDIQISMEKLKTDYIDLYQVHNPSLEELEQVVAPGGAVEALKKAKEAGKIGHIGITLHSVDLFEKALQMDWVETIMFPYNIIETQAEALIEQCTEKNIGFIAMKPMAGGAIDDPQLAIRFLMKNPNVTIAIPGVATLEEAQQNILSAIDQSLWTEQDREKAEKIRQELGVNFCRRCRYCEPCSAGISICSVLLLDGYYHRYGLQDWARARYNAMPAKASDCIGCGICETRCPYNLPIRELMQKAEKFFE